MVRVRTRLGKACLLSSLVLLVACNQEDTNLHGYVEARLTYLSAPVDGKLVNLPIKRGLEIKQGDKVFILDPMPQQADLNIATVNIEEATANLQNLLKGEREPELEVIRGEIDDLKANVKYFRKQIDRHQKLVNKGAIEKEQLDKTILSLSESIAQLKSAEAKLSVAKLPAREDVIEEARKKVEAIKSEFEKAKWLFEQKEGIAPYDSFVFDTYFKEGENVPANRPVLSLFAWNDVKAIFYVPEARLSQVKLKGKVTIDCDQCEKMEGKVEFISPIAEYTPPVIYSQASRSKLVYRIEAIFSENDSRILHPGQPIDVYLSE